MPGRRRRRSRGPPSTHESKKLGDAARVTRARAGTGVAMPGAASRPAATARRAQGPLAASLRHPAEIGVTFADIALYFSREEWRLLDEAHKRLYLDVMLENFELVAAVEQRMWKHLLNKTFL
ncbi:zinc finger protein 211-like isoform X4 [Pteronotus mesoamericanus]|uniref:zinc finger protein 211-like isoform X4 n=1 Tax=Pteronotus mesoamericanus TaxID=1884717 RepID=UPI0023EB6877|nr:zinc finger protein 211-like isoform X4 [Pteronotus parnellii mesoamericanus]